MEREAMTQEERIEELENQLLEMQALLEETINGSPKKVGRVVAGPDERGLYRVNLGGSDEVITQATDIKGNPLPLIKHDTEVVITCGIVSEVITDDLKPEIEELDFTRVAWDEIRGLRSQVNVIRKAIEGPLNNPELYREFGLPPVKGLALYGPPGVGKTKIAKAIASTMLDEFDPDKESFVYLKGGELLSKYVGEAENNIKNIFDTCRKYIAKTGKKSIIFIDEAEAIVPKRGSRKSSDVDTTIVPTFLAEMDGINDHNPFVILATNHLDQIDPAIIRPGRIDLTVEITRPTKDDAADILDYYLDKTKLHDKKEDLMLATLSYIKGDEEFRNKISGAELEGLVKKFTMCAINRMIDDPKCKERGVTLRDLEVVLTEGY